MKIIPLFYGYYYNDNSDIYLNLLEKEYLYKTNF